MTDFITVSPDELHPDDVLVNERGEAIGRVTRVHHIWGAVCAHVGDVSYKLLDDTSVRIAR